ncbi:MAG: nitrite/sulfite reductase [Verrucomicrobiales bacterium]
MIDIAPNFAAVKQGLIKVTPQERMKLEKDGLDVIHDIYRYAKQGFEAISDDDFDRMKWYGVYRQKPKDSGYFMLRTKVPGGQVTGPQAVLMSQLTEEYARGFCDITTRQTIQFHWLRIEDFPDIFARLAGVGIITSGACGDDTRNVCGCPVAGIDPNEIIDGTPQLIEVNRRLTNNRAFSNLPRKYKISIGGCHIHCTQPDINCVGVFGMTRQFQGRTEVGYGVKVGGGLSAAPHMAQVMPIFLRPQEVGEVVEAITAVYRDHGYRHTRNKARFKFLVADWGAERITKEVEEIIGRTLTEHHDFEFPADQETDHLGIHPQKQAGLNYVGVSFAGGRIRHGLLESIGRLAMKYAAPGQDAIRLTNKQNLLMLNIPDAHVEPLKKELDEAGLVYDPSNFRQGCVSCTGIEFCNLAIAETKNRMVQMVSQLEEQCSHFDEKIRIHFSGCPSSCGQHQIADIGFRGARTKIDGTQVDAFDMFVGGRLGELRSFNSLVLSKVPASDVHLIVDKTLRFYKANRNEGEMFADFCIRTSKEQWQAELKKS